MKKNAVHLGEAYIAKVSGKLVAVRLDAENPHGGWDGTNVETRRKVRIKSAQRLRAEVSGATRPAGLTDAPVARDATTETRPPKVYDPNRCVTPRCKSEPALTYLGKPLCQKCWERHCEENPDPLQEREPGGDSDADPPCEMVTDGAVPFVEAESFEKIPGDILEAADQAPPPKKCSNRKCNEPAAHAYCGTALCDGHWAEVQAIDPDANDTYNPSPRRDDAANHNAGNAPANTGDAGELDTEDMTTKTKNKKSKVRKGVTKAPATRKPKAPTRTTPANGDAKSKRVSAIDAAAQILKDKGTPMRSREIIEAAAAKGLWTSPAGKTPHATLDAAMRREINVKGKDARFTIEDRGLFGYNAKAGA